MARSLGWDVLFGVLGVRRVCAALALKTPP